MCECIEQMQARLAEKPEWNTVLEIPIMLDLNTGQYMPPRVKISTVKQNSRNRAKAQTILPIFCPFCGKRYIEEPVAEVPA